MDNDDSSCLILVLVNDSSRHFVLNAIKRDRGWATGKDLHQDSCGQRQDTSLLFALR